MLKVIPNEKQEKQDGLSDHFRDIWIFGKLLYQPF